MMLKRVSFCVGRPVVVGRLLVSVTVAAMAMADGRLVENPAWCRLMRRCVVVVPCDGNDGTVSV